MQKSKKWGLENFKRDTMWVAVLDTIFPKGFNADSEICSFQQRCTV